jgi:hypothetical protein
MNTYQQLEMQYELGKAKFDNGEEVNRLEVMFVGYALDAVDTGMRNFKVELDFSENSVKEVERILDILNKTLNRDKPSDATVMSFAKQFSGYIGQVMMMKWGGEWIDESNYSFNNGHALRIGEQDLFLLSKVHRRITRGPEENVYHFFQVIKKDIEGASDLNEVNIERLVVKDKKNWIQKIFNK